MTCALEPLSIDTDPAAYRALNAAVDEPAADAGLSPRELAVRDLAREIVAHQVAPRAAEADQQGWFVHESVQVLAAAGLCRLLFPARLGGTDDTTVAYALAVEEIAAGCAATSLVFITQMHAAYPILIGGTDVQAQRYVPGLLDGSVYGSLAITEPESGSDVSSLHSTAVPSGDGTWYRLNGSKVFITTGDRADVIVCFASTDRARGRHGISAFVVEGGWLGVGRGRPAEKMGMHGSTTAALYFQDVAVPTGNRLGRDGDGWDLVMRSVVKSRISAAAQGVGLGRAAYVRSLATLSRLYGDRIPADAKSALAGMRARLLQGRLMLHAAARQVDAAATPPPAVIAMVKHSCTDLGWQLSVDATRILGPYGDLGVFGVERCLRDARVTQIYDGTNEIQRLIVSRDLPLVNGAAP
jgi:alkylation response protein AidB-like acyl-CoA dehydrogenase